MLNFTPSFSANTLIFANYKIELTHQFVILPAKNVSIEELQTFGLSLLIGVPTLMQISESVPACVSLLVVDIYYMNRVVMSLIFSSPKLKEEGFFLRTYDIVPRKSWLYFLVGVLHKEM